jgi:hypothetical protein
MEAFNLSSLTELRIGITEGTGYASDIEDKVLPFLYRHFGQNLSAHLLVDHGKYEARDETSFLFFTDDNTTNRPPFAIRCSLDYVEWAEDFIGKFQLNLITLAGTYNEAFESQGVGNLLEMNIGWDSILSRVEKLVIRDSYIAESSIESLEEIVQGRSHYFEEIRIVDCQNVRPAHIKQFEAMADRVVQESKKATKTQR